ncbi:MAG TPA: hypothetical protein VK523_07900 [Steroidobacteraceae bacterium]|nr:hypothetical protein [Steroidobacteraceae bacterium]
MSGQATKEIAIAVDVFGKNSDFDVSQDALVRVYIHKLRKALEDFYASPAGGGIAELSIPRGEYRVKATIRNAAVTANATATANAAVTTRPPVVKLKRLQLLGAAGMLAAIGLLAAGIAWRWAPSSDLMRVRDNPIWSTLLKDDRPIMIIVGDYYLIGETDDSMGVNRLIREYSVNSKSDLEHFVAEHPKLADRYMDVGLRYLPISTAFALRDVMVVLAPENRRITVSKMSDVEPSSLKSADIVYIGYLSGMGMLQDIVFAGSRFSVGDSYDEVFDKKTRHSYVSEIGSDIMDPPQPTGKERPYHDYGVFAKIRGPGDNTIVVLSGTRDEGVRQTAEAFTSAQKLEELEKKSDVTLPIEALLEVSAVDGVNLTGKLLLQSNRDKTT